MQALGGNFFAFPEQAEHNAWRDLLPCTSGIGCQHHHLVFRVSYLFLAYAAALVAHFGVEKPFLLLKQALNNKNQEKSQVHDMKLGVAAS